MYKLLKFGTTNLPGYDFSWTAGTGPTLEALAPLVGGRVWEAYGDDTAPLSLPYALRYEGASYSTAVATLRSELDALRALRGQRLRLYREAQDDDSLHWCWARLMAVGVDNTVQDHAYGYQRIVMEYLVSSMWYGAAHGGTWTLDSGEYLDTALYLDENELFTLDASPKNLSVDNDGNVAQPNVVITITAGSADITEITVTISGVCEWTYDGTISAGNALTVNCGAFTVKNNGASDYANFELTSNHVVEEWFVLAPGDNTVVVTKTGGDVDSTILFEYSDGWA